MRRLRLSAFLGVASAGVLVALGASNCAAPTQISVDVRADRSICSGARTIEQTGIAVSTPAAIEDEPLEIFQDGCRAGGVIGTLTVSPSGEDDAEVAIRIVAGINKSASACAPPWDDCILARRTIRFSPGKTVPVTVILELSCVGKVCGEDQECKGGACIDRERLLPDGGVGPEAGPKPEEEAGPPLADASEDVAPIDAGFDACTGCEGDGKICTDGKKCKIDCTGANGVIDCTQKSVCAPGLDCTVLCRKANACPQTHCGETSGTCDFQCTTGNGENHCTNISCDAGTCAVSCADVTTACVGVSVAGKQNDITCTPVADAPRYTCDRVRCTGDVCSRDCKGDKLGCGPDAGCDGGCGGFQRGDSGPL